MTTPIDTFLLKTMSQSVVLPGAARQTENDVDLPLFVPVMTLDRFSVLSGIPRGVLQGNCDRGYIPTHVIGRRRVVNVSRLNQLLLVNGGCHDSGD